MLNAQKARRRGETQRFRHAERNKSLQKLAMKQKEAEERRKANTKGELRGVGDKVKPAAVKKHSNDCTCQAVKDAKRNT